MGLLVVGVADFVGTHKQLEGIINILIVESLFFHVFDLLDPFFLVAAELEFVLVAPEHFGFMSGLAESGEHVVEVDYLVAGTISH